MSRKEIQYFSDFNTLKNYINQIDNQQNLQKTVQTQYNQDYELVIDYVTYPVSYQLIKTTDKVIFDKSPIPSFLYKGQVITRKQLVDTFMKSILFNISKYHTRFVSNLEYYGKTDFVIYHPNINGYIEYEPDKGLYKIDFDNPQFGDDKLDENYSIEQVVEIYNVSRNETYLVVEYGDRYIKFIGPDQNEDVREDVLNSFYRITMYVSKRNIQRNKLKFDIESSYEMFFNKFFYVLKYIGNKRFDVFTIDFNQLQYYLQDNSLSFNDILERIQNEDFELGQTDMNGVVKETTLNFEQYNQQIFHDITLTISTTDGTNHTNYLDKLNVGDMFYFYVNRSETFTILIDDVTGNKTHISQDEFSSIIQFDNCNYLIRGTFYIFDQLPIRIQNRENITILGIDSQSSILNFNKQDFSNTDCLFEVVDSKDITFKDFKITTYDIDKSEIRPETYTEDKEVYQIKITQTKTDEKTTDNIKLEHLEINNVEQQLWIDETNIYTPEPPRTHIEHIQFKPHGLDVLELLVGQQSQYISPIDDFSIIPYKNILIGNGSEQMIQFNPNNDVLHFTTTTPNHLVYTFDDQNNKININVVNVQNEYHNHNQNNITSGLLKVEVGGTNNNSYTDQGIIIYNHQTKRFETHFTKDDVIQEQMTNVKINIVDYDNTIQFTLSNNNNFKFRSLTPHLIVGFDQQQKEINFDISNLVVSVNGKTGNVTLDYIDVGQQQENHLHDNRYVQLTQLNDYYTKEETDNLLDEIKNSIVVEVIDIQTNPQQIINLKDGDVYQIGTGQTNEWMGYDGNFQVYNGETSSWNIIETYKLQLQYQKQTNKLYICRYDVDEQTQEIIKQWIPLN